MEPIIYKGPQDHINIGTQDPINHGYWNRPTFEPECSIIMFMRSLGPLILAGAPQPGRNSQIRSWMLSP